MNKVLVTGGGGFLGQAIVRQLRAQQVTVVSCSRQAHPALAALGVTHHQLDLADIDSLRQAATGCDTVFHVAAKAGIWGDEADYHRINVQGTANVIRCCRELGIQRLVYTSSPSVVFGEEDIEGGDESIPCPSTFHAAYPRTKAEAERMVLAVNDDQLATVALRPHLIWGPGDHHLLPRLVSRARQGRLWRIGQRQCLVDTVYVDNAAEAHVLAARRLKPGNPPAGKAYFISNGEPVPLWDMVNRMLAAAGEVPVSRSVPVPLAVAAGTALETVYRLLNITAEPPITRFVAKEMSTAHWFDISAARRDLGYQPRISLDEGLQRLQHWLQTHH